MQISMVNMGSSQYKYHLLFANEAWSKDSEDRIKINSNETLSWRALLYYGLYYWIWASFGYLQLINYTNKLVAQLNLHVCVIMLMDVVAETGCTLWNFVKKVNTKNRNSDISNVNEIKPYWYCNIEAHAVRIVSLNPKTIEIIHFDNYIQMVRSAIIMFTMLHTDTPC